MNIIYLDQYRDKIKNPEYNDIDEYGFCTDYYVKRYLIESDKIEVCHLKTTDSGRKYYILKAPYSLKGAGIKIIPEMNTKIKGAIWYGYQLNAKALIKLSNQFLTIKQAVENAKQEDEIMLSHGLLPVNRILNDDILKDIL